MALLVIAGAGGWVWYRAHQLFRPTPVIAPRTLGAYADEAAPARPPTAAAEPLIDWARLATPPREAMPWVRWWWPGADVEPAELRRELGMLRDAGFGGAEVQPFSFGTRPVTDHDPAAKARVFGVDTPRYFGLLQGLMRDAGRLGMRIDLTHYSGWPAGSPVVTPANGTQSLAWSEARFTGGRRVEIAVPRPSPGINAWGVAIMSIVSGLGDFGDFDSSAARLVSAVVARPVGGGHRLFSIEDTLRLDPASVRVVDAQLRGGKLVWDAPPGDWVLVASWIMPTGEQSSLAAMPPPAYIVDILSAPAVRAHYNYTFGARSGLAPFYGGAFRALFNDSLEFKADRLSSRDFLTEFRRRRGYDLRRWLPVVYRAGADDFTLGELIPPVAPDFALSADDARIRHDYQQTLSELTVERFLDPSRDWAAARGLLSRGQSYGMDLDIIAAQGANDIPETEQLYGGGSDAFLRMTSAAALLYGRRLVSAESFVWAAQDYASSGAKLKLAADRFLLAGINHIIYHGYPYDWRRGDRARWFADIGWDPWSSPERRDFVYSGNYSERTPLWADIGVLNTYIGRAQNLMRQGAPQADVLVYYPFLGWKTRGYGPGDTREPLMFGEFPLTDPKGVPSLRAATDDETDDERILWLRRVQPVLDALAARGLTWSWVNGDGLRQRIAADGRTTGGGQVGGVLFADTEAVAPADIAAARALARGGLPVFVHGRIPVRQPGFHDAARGDATVRSIAASLRAARGDVADPRALADRIAAAVRPSVAYAPGSAIRRAGRVLSGGASIDFFANESGRAQRVSLTMAGGGWWFDATTGAIAPIPTATGGGVALDLLPYQSRFLIRGIPYPGTRAPATFAMRPVASRALTDWRMRVGGEERRGLVDWLADPRLRHLAAPALYRSTVTLPATRAGDRIVLRVAPQPGTAFARVNGHVVGLVSVPPGEIDVTGLLHPGANRIEIVYRAPIRNALIGAAAGGDARLRQFKGRTHALVPAGLRGSIALVTLTAPR